MDGLIIDCKSKKRYKARWVNNHLVRNLRFLYIFLKIYILLYTITPPPLKNGVFGLDFLALAQKEMQVILMDYDLSERAVGRLSRHCPLTAMPARRPLAYAKKQQYHYAPPCA